MSVQAYDKETIDKLYADVKRLTAERDHWKGRAIVWADRAGRADGKRILAEAALNPQCDSDVSALSDDSAEDTDANLRKEKTDE